MSIFSGVAQGPPKSGFRWVDAAVLGLEADWDYEEGVAIPSGAYPVLRRGRFLTPSDPRELESAPFYDALTDPEYGGLFKNFADLTPTEGEIVQFANRYGWLGDWRETAIPANVAKDLDLNLLQDKLVELDDPFISIQEEHGISAERLTGWRDQISLMRGLVALWEALRSGHSRDLSGSVYEDENGSIVYDYRRISSQDSEELSFSPIKVVPDESDLIRFGNLRSGDSAGAGWVALRKIINAQLSGGSAPNLSWRGADLLLTYRASGLKRVMWFQFALAVQGSKRYERCRHCKGFFEIGPSAGRRGKTYCSNACRTAAYRLRKEQTK